MFPKAALVYDHQDFKIPKAMGKPKDGQFAGTELENFAELCGRICYDSVGKGRDSISFHENILNTKHYNIYEGCVRTFELLGSPGKIAQACVNRPGIWLVPGEEQGLRLTMNARSMIEWDRHTKWHVDDQIKTALQAQWARLMPLVFDEPEQDVLLHVRQVVPIHEHEKWITLWLLTSRAVSHEQVRHRWMCHVSQRSTRYCNESEAPRIEHPLLRAYRAEKGEIGVYDGKSLSEITNAVYDDTYNKLNPWLADELGYDKFSARKQARGVAREFLEHQLATQMMFGASVEAWKWMISQRGSKWADGAIQELYLTEILESLKESQYGEEFDDV